MRKNENTNKKNNLSDAAETMRNNPDPKKRSDAAKTMGQAGGSNSRRNSK